MKDRRNRILAILEYLEREVMTSVTPVEGVMIADYRYDLKETISEEGLEWHDFRRDGTWGGHDKHYMFKADVTATEEGKPFAVTVATGDTDLWNTDNPQILMYLKTTQWLSSRRALRKVNPSIFHSMHTRITAKR